MRGGDYTVASSKTLDPDPHLQATLNSEPLLQEMQDANCNFDSKHKKQQDACRQ